MEGSPPAVRKPYTKDEMISGLGELTEDEKTLLRDILCSPEPQAAPVTTGSPAEPAMPGGKRKGRRATKKGGDMGAGLLTAGTLLLLQAAAKSLLKKQQGGSKKQRGGEVIQSVPAPFGGDASLVQSTLAGGSMCGAAAQMGGKRKTSSRKQQRGGALNTSGELDAAFGPIGGYAGIAEAQAGTAMVQVPPFEVTGGVSQDGGKRKTKSRKQQKGGGCGLQMADLDAAFSQETVAGAIPFPAGPVPTSPMTLTALHPQTGGKRKSKSQTKSRK